MCQWDGKVAGFKVLSLYRQQAEEERKETMVERKRTFPVENSCQVEAASMTTYLFHLRIKV